MTESVAAANAAKKAKAAKEAAEKAAREAREAEEAAEAADKAAKEAEAAEKARKEAEEEEERKKEAEEQKKKEAERKKKKAEAEKKREAEKKKKRSTSPEATQESPEDVSTPSTSRGRRTSRPYSIAERKEASVEGLEASKCGPQCECEGKTLQYLKNQMDIPPRHAKWLADGNLEESSYVAGGNSLISSHLQSATRSRPSTGSAR